MNNKEEAERLWVEKSKHLSNDEAWAYCAGISDFKAALIQAVEKDKDEYIKKRNIWKHGSKNYENYDLAVKIHNNFLARINETKPL